MMTMLNDAMRMRCSSGGRGWGCYATLYTPATAGSSGVGGCASGQGKAQRQLHGDVAPLCGRRGLRGDARIVALQLKPELAARRQGHRYQRVESQGATPGADGGTLLGHPLHPYAEVEGEHERPGGLQLDIRSRLRDLDESGCEVPRVRGPGVADLVDLARHLETRRHSHCRDAREGSPVVHIEGAAQRGGAADPPEFESA